MQSVQKSQPTFNEMLRMGIRADEIGSPQAWPILIRQSTIGDLECTDKLLTNINKPKAQDYLVRLASRDLTFVAEFFNSLQIPFFFVGWDHPQSTVVQRCGPDRKSVLSLLSHQPVTERPTAGPDNDRLNRVWQAAGIVLDELQIRDDISFSLVWDPHCGKAPEFDFSGYDRPVAWHAFFQSLPLVERCHISREPPSSRVELEIQRIEPAPPSKLEPDPALCSGVVWHQLQQNNFDCDASWRWSRAWSIVRHNRNISKKRDDVETGKAVRFLRQLVKQPQNPHQLADGFVSLLTAHELYAGDRDRSRELECRLLSRQSSVEIAQQMSVSSAAVNSFHAVFFDVVGRLNAKTYVAKKLLGLRGGLADYNQSPEGLLKSIAYFGGPAVFDAVLGSLREHSRCLATVATATPPLNPLVERLELLADAINLPSDAKTSSQLLKALPELFAESPITGPKQRWTGVFAQIVTPFQSEFASSAGELQAEGGDDQQAA